MKFIDEMIDRKRRESADPALADAAHAEDAVTRPHPAPLAPVPESDPGPPPGFDRADLPEPLSWPPRGSAEDAAAGCPAPSMTHPGRRPPSQRIAPPVFDADPGIAEREIADPEIADLEIEGLEIESPRGADETADASLWEAFDEEDHAGAPAWPAPAETPGRDPMQAQTRPLTMFDQGRRRSTSPLRLIDPIEEAGRDTNADATTELPDPGPEDVHAAEPPPQAGRVKTRLLGFHTREDAPDLFASAPGAATAGRFPVGWLVVEKGPGRGAAFALYDGMSTIGRGEGQTVQLDLGDTAISRDTHAAVAYDDEARACFLGHGGKANLVRLNGRPVLSTERISHGDRIRLGETTLRFAALCGAEFSWSDDAEKTDSSGEGGTDAAAL